MIAFCSGGNREGGLEKKPVRLLLDCMGGSGAG